MLPSVNKINLKNLRDPFFIYKPINLKNSAPKNIAIIIAAISSSSLFERKLDKKYNRIGIKNGNKKIRKKFGENLSTSIDVNKIKARIS